MPENTPANMKTPHLVPALVAILILIAILLGGTAYVQALEERYVHALAPQELQLKITGSALQRIAFQQSDLLPVYGSSEMLYPSTPYSATAIFRNYPTGFTPFVVARNGMTSLITAQSIASIGPDLRGKKVVISFTPAMFHVLKADKQVYAGSFSGLHANEFVFNTDLSLETKQLAAQRMREYPKTLKPDPVLNFALEKLADESPLGSALYYAAWPLGKLQTTILELQDQWETLQTLVSQEQLDPVVRRTPAAIDWSDLKVKTELGQKARANSNPYGVDNQDWIRIQSTFEDQIARQTGRSIIEDMNRSAEWTDLDILLHVLKELGAQPLLLSRPINGTCWQALGVSEQARQTSYYERLQQAAQRYNVPLVDFQDHDTDKYFNVDPTSHTSQLGWVYVDQALDTFYHQAVVGQK